MNPHEIYYGNKSLLFPIRDRPRTSGRKGPWLPTRGCRRSPPDPFRRCLRPQKSQLHRRYARRAMRHWTQRSLTGQSGVRATFDLGGSLFTSDGWQWLFRSVAFIALSASERSLSFHRRPGFRRAPGRLAWIDRNGQWVWPVTPDSPGTAGIVRSRFTLGPNASDTNQNNELQ